MTAEQEASALDRLNDKIAFQENDCWHYIGRLDADGYGLFWFVDETRRAHRVSYELLNGPIPDGHVLDHACHDPKFCAGGKHCLHRRCINPEHLVAIPWAENTKSGRKVAQLTPEGKASRLALFPSRSRTHCLHGHEYTPNNVKIRLSGGRTCKECSRLATRECNARKRGNVISLNEPPKPGPRWNEK